MIEKVSCIPCTPSLYFISPMIIMKRLFTFALLVFFFTTHAQKSKTKKTDPVYVDPQGVMRWRSNDQEASFFGTNYTTPFAYGYRAHKALGIDPETAIRQDVYHLARIGLDAFRVHVWDTEISDVAGNLLENDHLRLYDFLVAEMKKRNIKIIITPIAFWGNGYPERDEATPGFSRFYGRGKLTTNDSAIVAQETYLKQFFKHVNPYTKLAYGDDPDVIAVEINNEPSHSGPKPGVTNYINRLAVAIKSTGWTKPIFYNISQGPYYADAVAASAVDGFSFQWYPSGLVSGNTLKGNYLANVDQYQIPFDTIPAFAKKALMVYEFDAADIMQPVMYPAMARSFRQAGFQWATQFAYDPMALAYANTEYQTHYVNLAYTPGKAISLLIASKAFHRLPRLKNFGHYPTNNRFDVFRIDYASSLSEMNSEDEFYYSNSTVTKPVNPAKLRHIAGVGNSPVINCDGLGAYFLDKLEDGAWRLELMPDAVPVRDPFERASPKKEVTRIVWRNHSIQIDLPDLGTDFEVAALNEGNTFTSVATSSAINIGPGSYLLTRKGKKYAGPGQVGTIALKEFVAPKTSGHDIALWHQPYSEASSGSALAIRASVVGLDSGTVTLQVNRLWGPSKSIVMKETTPFAYSAEIPADLVAPGQLNYRIIVRHGNDFSVFPGNIKGDPASWDNYQYETYKTFVAASGSKLELFNPNADRVMPHPTWQRGFQVSYPTGDQGNQLVVRLNAKDLSTIGLMGFQYSFPEKVKGRMGEINSLDVLVIRARANQPAPLKAKVALVYNDASAASSMISLTPEFRDIEIPISSLSPDSSLLLPRPYPGFQSLKFKNTAPAKEALHDAEKIEVTVGGGISPSELKKEYEIEVERIWFQKSK